jgi:hypothetical protein
MQLPAPKWFATIYAVLFGIALVASILGAAGILVAVPLAVVAWFLVKIMFFGLALVIAALAVLALASNLIPSSVPVTKQRVHFQLTPGEARLDEGATFAPIEVYGPGGYSVTVHPEGGPDNLPRTRYTYDVPMPNRGLVRITPGNQPTVALDAAVVSAGGGATVYYAHLRKGRYGVAGVEHASAVDEPGEPSAAVSRNVFQPPA